MSPSNASILVTGDIVLDHNLYAGGRFKPDAPSVAGLRHIASPGGAMLTFGLLDSLRNLALNATAGAKPEQVPDVFFGLKETTAPELEKWPRHFMVGAVWDQFEGTKKNEMVWRLDKNLGYGPVGPTAYPAHPATDLNKIQPRVLVIDDGGLGFRFEKAETCWPSFLRTGSATTNLQWIILKMSYPLARGDLWWSLVDRWKEKLIVVVAADDLRREDARVTRGLSWESTVDDLLEEIRNNPAVSGLQSCTHLIVTLRGDGALWMARPGQPDEECRLVFDRARAEGEWDDTFKGEAFGYLSAVSASLAWRLWDQDPDPKLNLVPAIKAGLSTSRFLRQHGHGRVHLEKADPGFPFDPAAIHLTMPEHAYVSSNVDAAGDVMTRLASSTGPSQEEQERSRSRWTILRHRVHFDKAPGPLFGPARRLALVGPGALADAPCAQFGKLLTLDRGEIEALRAIRQLMLTYHHSGLQKQPLCLAVFGSPGSGKSFGLKQIAEGVFGVKNPILEFNLSQFRGPEDLIGAYHQVRDHALGGKTPVVFWDEFDSRSYFWLQYLLAPMQDGVFQEGQMSHSIGKSVFIFAGGTSRDFAHFGPSDEPLEGENDDHRKARIHFIMAKGPDFKSRLAAYFNVLGPNPRSIYQPAKAMAGLNPWEDDPTDLDFPVRRAILLRALLGCGPNDALEIDGGLLTALLQIGHYRHGARSMEKLIGQMLGQGERRLWRAQLPSNELLALYVDNVMEFNELMRRARKFLYRRLQAEVIAPTIHQDFLDNLPEEQRANHPYNKPYDQLDSEAKQSNLAAAERIPEILALAGFELVEGQATKDEDDVFAVFVTAYKDMLAEAEHDGWADQKRKEGWTYGPKKDLTQRTHPSLVPFADLPEEEKNKDRKTIENYSKYAKMAGFKIVKMRGGEK